MSPKQPDREELAVLYTVLDEFKKINPAMSVQQIMAFLLVARKEGLSLKELVEQAQVKTPTMSRHLIDLGPRNRRMEPGFQLVECRQDPMEMRKNQYTLSPRGRYLVNSLLKKMG